MWLRSGKCVKAYFFRWMVAEEDADQDWRNCPA
jgi:hypothetical protein